MIVEFSVRNFRSIKELQTLSFAATGLKSPEELSNVDENNICLEDDTRLLKTVGIYGPNASGKSNIIRALDYFIKTIKNEASSESNLSTLNDPFLYQTDANSTESYFQIVLIIEKKKYRYGFTVKKNLSPIESENKSKEVISSEWLFGTKEKNSGEYFTRSGAQIQKELLPNSEKIPPLPYEHTLFLTHATAFDSQGVCSIIRNFFKGWTISNFTDGFLGFRRNSLHAIEHEKKKEEFLTFLSAFNLKYTDIILERDPNKPGIILSQDKIFLKKSYKNERNQVADITLNLSYHESAGTQKLFDIAGLLLRAFSMAVPGLVIVDEVDSNFHPSLLIKVVSLFNNPTINKSKSQLLFTSHDTNLLSPSIMRRDQFYFTEKKDDLSTRLYSLADLRGIRNDADFAKQYLAGFYGGLPVLDNYMSETSELNDRSLES